MSEITQILSAVEQGDPHAAEQLLPLVYEELRRLAAQKLAHESPGQTLQATALVHEAYLRLVTPPLSPPSQGGDKQRFPPSQGGDNKSASPPYEGGDKGGVRYWDSRGHFFAAAAEAMRRILVNRARDKGRQKRGGGLKRVDLEDLAVADEATDDELVAVDEALERLAVRNQPCAELVKLRFFAGLTMDEAAATLGISPRTAHRYWAFARAWLYDSLAQD